MRYSEALAYIHGRPKAHKDATMKRMQLLMEHLHHPERKLNAIHVAGTNGKGSVVAFFSNLLQTAGLDVGTFTSPYLVRFNERISVNGVPISDQTVVRLVELIVPIVAKIDKMMPNNGPTEFEVLTAMMFAYFAEGHADVIIIEVGIGGDNDSTNVVQPKLSVITTIGYDHMQFLGGTLESIAQHKAGIIKPHVPVVIGRIDDAPRQVIIKQAVEQHSVLKQFGQDFMGRLLPATGWHERFDFSNSAGVISGLQLNLLGDFQVDNAAVAIEAFMLFMHQSQLPISSGIIKQGVADTKWAGRFEMLNAQPLVVIDGAHNLPAMEAIAQNLKRHFADRTVYIIIAILSDKQYLAMLETIAKLPNVHLILTEFGGAHQRAAADLQVVATTLNAANEVSFIANWQTAIMTVTSQMDQDEMLLITGSLYFISEVRALFKG